MTIERTRLLGASSDAPVLFGPRLDPVARWHKSDILEQPLIKMRDVPPPPAAQALLMKPTANLRHNSCQKWQKP
jgi:hypothetical protein